MLSALRDEIARVAEEHAPEGGYGETAFLPGPDAVLWCHADWTGVEEHDAAEKAFLAIEGVKELRCESEGMPEGWCEAEPVWGGNPFKTACAEREVVAAAAAGLSPYFGISLLSASELKESLPGFQDGVPLRYRRPPELAAITAAVRPPVPVAVHNEVLVRGYKRAEELEPRLIQVLEPILRLAGERAADAFERLATNHLTAALTQEFAAEAVGRGTMIALFPRADEAEALAQPGGEPAGILHVTVAYLGKTEGPLTHVRDALAVVAGTHGPLEGQVGGVGLFGDNGDGHPMIALPSVPGLTELRVDVTKALHRAGIDYGRDWGYQPHVTLDYGEPATPDVGHVGKPLHFSSLWIVRGDDERVELPLTGSKPLTASGGLPDWTPPAGDEIVNIRALVDELRAKTDPVRQAVVESVMTPALEAAGLSFDVTNPLTRGVLAQSGAHVQSIADTTRLNVMRAVRHGYEQGLSIPDTATAIRAGMAEASTARATLIARTEMAGAVNGGSLAATRIVGEATGTDYQKEWLTAPGAPYPRHELYEGLDGQTVALDGVFRVGDDQLQYPGDPAGSPEEVCNCRCSMAYVEGSGTAVDAGSADTGIDDAPSSEPAEEEAAVDVSASDALDYYHSPKAFDLNASLRNDVPLTPQESGVVRALDATAEAQVPVLLAEVDEILSR